MNYNKENINTLKKITSLNPPVIANFPSGKYAIFTGPEGGWFNIDDTVTLEMVQSRWSKWKPKNADTVNTKIKSIKIKGSKGNMYNVTINNGNLSCDCVGYGFRRRCKHVEQAKRELGVAA